MDQLVLQKTHEALESIQPGKVGIVRGKFIRRSNDGLRFTFAGHESVEMYEAARLLSLRRN